MFGIQIKIDKQVLLASLPIMMGYFPLGLACGVLAGSVGLSTLDIALMSIFVFAGSGQFIALAMMGSGAAAISSIVLTTFIRHLLYSSTLVKYISSGSHGYHMAFAQEIVDETFAVNENRFSDKEANWTMPQALGMAYASHGAWVISTVLGQILGSMVEIDITLVGYTLTAMFIGLWSFHFKNHRLVIVGLFAGALALWLSTFLDYKLHIVISTVAAATVGMLWENSVQKDEVVSA